MNFAYKAKDSSGKTVTGTIEAKARRDALRSLQNEGRIVIDIREADAPLDKQAVMVKLAAQTVKRDEVIAFSTQLAVMLDTGVALPDALDAYLKQSRAGGMKTLIELISSRVTNGVAFSVAIAEFPKVFPTLMVSLMKASEASGKMGLMLARISDYLSKERRTARQIKGALTYPLVMVSLALAVTSFLVAWVLPRFAKIYESRQAALPKPTQIVLAISNFVTAHWPWIVAGIVALVVGVVAAHLHPKGRRVIDTIKLRAPVIGPMFTQCYLARACRTLGTLLGSGVTMLDSVRIVREIVPNARWRELWRHIEEALTQGRNMSDVVSQSPLIPPSFSQMIAAGERSGRIADVMDRVAAAAETDLDESVKTATQLIEPAMIIFMGGTIGGIAIALLLPIFSVASVVSK
ncbi:MAG TPA: type II secretion system F family protein [Phycisphaerales bacterium]|nr:type II secretion system F family protein [Phycisphaerales bacterium]